MSKTCPSSVMWFILLQTKVFQTSLSLTTILNFSVLGAPGKVEYVCHSTAKETSQLKPYILNKIYILFKIHSAPGTLKTTIS